MTRIKRDSIAYFVVIGFCILMLIWAIPTYTPPYPGYGASPALVPVVAVCIMLFMACLSLTFIGLALFKKKPIPADEREFPEDMKDGEGFTQVGRVNLKHLASTMLPCVFLVIAIEYIGYMLTAFIFLMMFQYAIGGRRWMQMAMLSVILTAALYIVMRYGFSVPIPGAQLFD